MTHPRATPANNSPAIAVIGAGPAGLIAAETLASAGFRVAVYDRMPSVGRKFLMAGRGGLNLTHSEPLDAFLARYGAERTHLESAVRAFPPDALRTWSDGLGEETFIGSSGRVFPRSLKASPLLRAWLARLSGLGVDIRTRRSWTGWDAEGRLTFIAPGGVTETVSPAATILALGGASWPKLGSDGAWTDILAAKGVGIAPLRPANSGFDIAWSAAFRERFEGQPLKTAAFTFAGRRVRGEAVIAGYGIEGGAIYALSSALREAFDRDGAAVLEIDLRPDVAVSDLAVRLSQSRPGDSLSSILRKAGGLSPLAMGLLREAAGADLPRRPGPLAGLIKAAPLKLTGVRPIERAISTAGGVAFAAMDEDFMLRDLPGVFAAGEMLDWEAPTGGYLLQACFATGAAAARGVMTYLGRAP